MADITIDDVKIIIREAMKLPADAAIADDASLVNDFGVDSLDAVEIAMELEDQFGCIIPDPAIKDMKTPALALEIAQRYMPK